MRKLLAVMALMWAGAAQAQPFVPPPSPPPPAQPVQACEALAGKLNLPEAGALANLRVDQVSAGAFAPPAGGMPASPGMSITGQLPGPNPAFCRIRATLKPSATSAIRIEVWMPAKDWNGKFIGVGNFGWGGSLPYANMQAGIERGYAVAGNDTGHDADADQSHGGRFLLGRAEALQDYAWRANHAMTLAAKAWIGAYYGQGPRRSYWIGCSLGGLQGLIEAKRYPEDYDGVVAGAPPNPLVDFNAAQLWPYWQIARDPALALDRRRLVALHDGAIKACAGEAGRKLGYIENPAACNFDPAQVRCRRGQRDACLSAAQVAFVRKVYRGPVDAAGKVIFPGPAKGSELEWGPFVSGREFGNAADLFRYAAFQQADWQASSLDWAQDLARARKGLGGLLEADDDLTAFAARGGRLLLYVGTNDYHNPAELAAYLDRVKARIGAKGDHYARLFVIPGMNHCGGGEGCDAWDKLEAIDAWVDRKAGRQPRMAHRQGAPGVGERTLPLCFYPDLAVYDGKGAVESASSYRCAAP